MHAYLDANSIQYVEWVSGQISLSATEISLLSYIRLVCSQVIKKKNPCAWFKSTIIEKVTIMFLHVPYIKTQLINSF